MIKDLLYMRLSVRLSIQASVGHILNINLNISFIYKDIFTNFVVNVYGYVTMSVQNFGLIMKKKMAAIADCLKIMKFEILKLASSNLHKRCIGQESEPDSNFDLVSKIKWPQDHIFNVKWGYRIKKALYFPYYCS